MKEHIFCEFIIYFYLSHTKYYIIRQLCSKIKLTGALEDMALAHTLCNTIHLLAILDDTFYTHNERKAHFPPVSGQTLSDKFYSLVKSRLLCYSCSGSQCLTALQTLTWEMQKRSFDEVQMLWETGTMRMKDKKFLQNQMENEDLFLLL